LIDEIRDLIGLSFIVFALAQTAIWVADLLTDQLRGFGWVDHERD